MDGDDYRLLLHPAPDRFPYGDGVKGGVREWDPLEAPNLWVTGPPELSGMLLTVLGVGVVAGGWRLVVLDDMEGADHPLADVFSAVAETSTDRAASERLLAGLMEESRRRMFLMRRNQTRTLDELPTERRPQPVLTIIPHMRRAHYQRTARLITRDGLTGIHVACAGPPPLSDTDSPLLIDQIMAKHFDTVDIDPDGRTLLPHQGGGRRRAMNMWRIDLTRNDITRLLKGNLSE